MRRFGHNEPVRSDFHDAMERIDEEVEVLNLGVDTWNMYIKRMDGSEGPFEPKLQATPGGRTILFGADFSNMVLDSIDLQRAGLEDAVFEACSLIGASFMDSHLERCNFKSATLRNAGLEFAHVSYADFSNADCQWARFAWFYGAGPSSFRAANLSNASFDSCEFEGVDFTGAILDHTRFTSCDFSGAHGLDSCVHRGPSQMDVSTLATSTVSDDFLRATGLPDTWVTYRASLTLEPIEYYACFISYSSADTSFAERLYNDLRGRRVRCWYAPDSMKSGDRIRNTIEDSIRVYDKMILILSENSLCSGWVEAEVEGALEKEEKTGSTALIPLKIDSATDDSREGWARYISRTRHIGDFTGWKNYDRYQKSLERLLRDIKS